MAFNDKIRELQRMLEHDSAGRKYSQEIDDIVGTTSSEIYYGYKRVIINIINDTGIPESIKKIAKEIETDLSQII